MEFAEFGLIEPLLTALRFEGYSHPTPIQEEAIPLVMEGRDLMGCAQTGTGKTAAFALPILQHLHQSAPAPQAAHDSHAHNTPHAAHGPHEPHAHGAAHSSQHGQQHGHAPRQHRKIRALVLAPTRELAAQINESFHAYGRHLHLKTTVIFGGVRQGPQVQAIRHGIDILVATPGRLLDLMGQGIVHLDGVERLVLDEADRMLDMGFINDIRRIVATVPTKRQTLMFSATMPREIFSLAQSILHDPVEVRVTPLAPAAETVHQTVYFVERPHKQALLEHVLADPSIVRALVFIRTKRGADRVCKRLQEAHIQADAIHSDRTQAHRERALKRFKSGQTRVLVASDIASRGLDVDDISHVINYDMPNEPETYVHRIGRTGRAGAAGKAISFCDFEERLYLDSIERLTRRPLETIDAHPFVSMMPRKAPTEAKPEVSIPGIGKARKRNLLRRPRGRR